MWMGWDIKRDVYGDPVQLLSSIPAFAETCILMLAFVNLERTSTRSRFQISRNQVILQISANFAFAVSELIPIFCKREGPALALGLLCGLMLCASLAVLTSTLAHVAELQNKYDACMMTHVTLSESSI